MACSTYRVVFMVQAAEERAATSRRNGARSKGPITDAGKLISSRNSTTHALTAKKGILPNECPELIAATTREWDDCFRPATPDACFLMSECIDATILARRFHTAYDSAVCEQMLALKKRHARKQRRRVEALRKHFAVDPADAFDGLRGFAHGCRWLADQLHWHAATLQSQGCWEPAQADQVIVLLGCRPGLDRLCEDEGAYLTALYNLYCQP